MIICDACVNWRNILEAKLIIRQCSEIGVDAVKFQAYLSDHAPGHPREKEINDIILTKQMILELYRACKDYGVEFLCTPMYPAAVKMLAPFVHRFKVRFADRDNQEILNEIKPYRLDKEVLISINQPRCDNANKYLYCIPEYPPTSSPWPVDFSQYDGFSSHYPDWQIPATVAKVYNLKYLEVHVMLDGYLGDWIPIDYPVSLSISNVRKLVKVLK